MRTLLALAILASNPAHASERRWLDVLVTTGATLVGEAAVGLGGAVLGGSIATATPDCDAGSVACQSAYATGAANGIVVGVALGGVGGAVGGAALMGADVKRVAITTGITGGTAVVLTIGGFALMSTEQQAVGSTLVVAGIGGGLIALPASAGVAAGHVPDTRPRARVRVAPVLAPEYRGVSVRGRF